MPETEAPGEGRAPRVEALIIYPLKSAGGIPVESVVADPAGLELDRRWMLVDGDRFMSQRTHPRMALLRPELTESALRVSFPGQAPLDLPLPSPAPPPGGAREDGGEGLVKVRVWFEDRWGADCGDDAAAWATGALGTPCRIVRAAGSGGRWAPGSVGATFADAFPALVLSTASLADLNERLAARGSAAADPLPMNRFRPNVVAGGLPPYAEDEWGLVRLGAAVIRQVRPCPRCSITTVDQATGVAGTEPLATLRAYRRIEHGGPGFGIYARFEHRAVLRRGDEITLIGPGRRSTQGSAWG